MSLQRDSRQARLQVGPLQGGYSTIWPVPDMDLGQIASSGQCFRMEERRPGLYSVIAGDRYAEIEETAGETAKMTGRAGIRAGAGMPEKGVSARSFKITCSGGPDRQEALGFWRHYFDLETDHGRIKALIPEEDTYLTQAARTGWGIRILRQDLWETIVTFIISQQNNIPRIRRCVRLLCERYGREEVDFRGEIYHAFPGPQELAGADLEGLKGCGLGYRARYILKSARMAAEGRFPLEELPSMSHEEAKAELMELCGVGVKVAECVCLFALHHTDAFPVDTHIAQALKAHYPDGFPFERYGPASGILQQYIFFYEVNKKQGAI